VDGSCLGRVPMLTQPPWSRHHLTLRTSFLRKRRRDFRFKRNYREQGTTL
jgi:hypothetical protein